MSEMVNDMENMCRVDKKKLRDGNVEEMKNEYCWEDLVEEDEE